MGDVNAENLRYLNHFFETDQAQSTKELYEILKRYQGIPWVNTIASDSKGRALYADIGAIPAVPNSKTASCNTALGPATDERCSACRCSTARARPATGTTSPTRSSPAPSARATSRTSSATTT